MTTPPQKHGITAADQTNINTASISDNSAMLRLISRSVFDTSAAESRIALLQAEIKSISGVASVPTGLSAPQHWDLENDLAMIEGNQFRALVVARISKILPPQNDVFRACISIRNSTNLLVGKSEKLAEENLEEDMRVGLGGKYEIKVPLPAALDPTVSLMQVDERPDTSYGDVGGCSK